MSISGINLYQNGASDCSDCSINDVPTTRYSNPFCDYNTNNNIFTNPLKLDEKLTVYQINEINYVETKYHENKKIYQSISNKVMQKTGKYIPPELIASIHYRESGCNFKTYFHNGEPLGKKTKNHPKGIYFDNFEDSAVDAIIRVGVKNIKNNDIESYMDFAERFNGLGYRKNGRTSPYVWSGTTKYKGGMYVADHKFSSTAKDKRCGVAVLYNHISDGSRNFLA